MLLRIVALLCLLTLAFGQLARPALNSLEQSKGKDLSAALTAAQNGLTQAQQAAAKAQADYLANQDAKKAAHLASAMSKTLDSAAKAKKPLAAAQANLDAWTQSTLAAHQADPSKYAVDWDAGTIKEKP